MATTTSRIPLRNKVTHAPVPPADSAAAAADDGKRHIQLHGWVVETCKMPILNSKEIKQQVLQSLSPFFFWSTTDNLLMDIFLAFGEKLKVPLPEICFGNNYVSIKHPRSGFHYQWNTLDALLPLNPIQGEEQDYIKVAYADHWSQARKEADCVTKVVNPFDWTYTTTYWGTNHSSEIKFSSPPDPKAHGGIPLAVLSRPDPILFFDEVTLFEDELHDNGMASLQVKVRVMPTCIFALSRFFLRVDGVIFRLFDVRFYAKEISYDVLKSRLPPENPHDLTPLTDPNFVSQALQMLKTEQFVVSSEASSTTDKPKKWRNMLGAAHLDLAAILTNAPSSSPNT
ncbi:hypothetical protein VP01_170g3 [Puccinia sorghi]|uniref:TIP41-like protein n=1 Tax=Puccinia sorghi TaxID=27349 RepID=A0A0L6VFJ6_9BASI|nr:hypothetical protein VP01_170g3 [Puccinia sorghi]